MTSWIQVLPSGTGTEQNNPFYQEPVENATAVAPPLDATTGQRFLLVNAQTAGQAFENYRYHIAVKTAVGWEYTAPLEGMRVYDKALDKEWVYSLPGYWVLATAESTVAFADITGAPTDNANLSSALGGKANTSHSHAADYAALGHNHDGVYSPVAHNHDADYADIAHDHDSDYAALAHVHAVASSEANGFMSIEDKLKLDGLETYGATTHAAYALSSDQTIATNTSAAVAFATEVLDPEGAFSLSSNSVVLRIGKAYLVNWNLSGYGDTAATKSQVTVALQQGPTSWAAVANSTAQFLVSDSANADNQRFSYSGSGVVITTSGDDRNVRLLLTTSASWGGVVLESDHCRIDVIELTAWGGGGGSGVWGFITGDIANQADLQSALSTHTHSAATTSVAGFMSAADKTKLDGVEASADVNQTAEEIADALDTFLGTSDWRTGGSGGGGDALQVSYYNSVQSSRIAAGSSANCNFDTASYTRSGASYSVSGGEITVNDTGTFFIVAKVAAVSDVANTKSVVNTSLQTDNSGSWANITGSTSVLPVMATTATAAYQIATTMLFGKITFATTGKKIKVPMSPVATWAPVKTPIAECWISIWKEGGGSGGGGGGGGAPGGVDRSVQFNNSGSLAGAAGVLVRSPSNGPGYTNHLLHANTYTCGYFTDTVTSGGSFWPDTYHDMSYQLTLAGSMTLKGGSINVANNSELASIKLYLKNNTASAVSVAVDTSSGQFTEVINLTNPFTIAANATRVVYCTARKDSSGTLTRAVEG